MKTARIYLREELRAAWGDRDCFDMVWSLNGEMVRSVANRATFRTQIGGRGYYVKRHEGVGWVEIFKNLITGKSPVLDASNEFRAANRLRAAGIDSLVIAGFGVRGRNPARRHSFIVSDEIAPVTNLEEVTLRWLESPPSAAVRRGLIGRVARIARTMHGLGMYHQDFYLCHLLMDARQPLSESMVGSVPIAVIDLHRAVIRRGPAQRLLVKDLGALHYSAREIGLTRRDVLRFLRDYFELPLREALTRYGPLLAACERRAAQLYAKARRKKILPRQLAGIDE
ncbi:MAG: lipopolysaccharide core heptose(I) kinase RfaP [Pseudomonadales bacterium]|nr:lipopolysaccharide core heptose(I) kinase RfaP [Pseudomonadales bacterium]MCP5185871.1 lipopolysaccharide core heptose(I) kinase RfaP [Pseudomonadales bacterium]